MMKRFFALLLCILMCAVSFAGCVLEEKEEVMLTPEEEELLKGAQINVHLSEMIYDFDPANAYHNETAMKLISLIYEPLFYLDENGKRQSRLVKKYEIVEDEEEEEYMLILYLAEDAYWSDGTYVSANDVVFSWKRILEAEASYEAAALLFDIKNARKANQGDISIDAVGLSAPSDKRVEITFEGKIDYEQFLLNLTSYALAPLRENLATKTSFYEEKISETTTLIVRKYNDWAKKGATIASSGPFKLRTIEYPDDPVMDEKGNYILSSTGELMYYRYGIDAKDGTTLVRLERGISYIEGENGEKIVYTVSYLSDLQKNDPDAYMAIVPTLSRIAGEESDYASEPQNSPMIIMERNAYYYKDMEADNWKVDKNVKPYRLIVDFSLSDQQILDAYENGEIFYVGNIPMSLRSEYKDKATVTDNLSTHTYYLNHNRVIKYSYIEFDADGLPMLYDKKNTKVLINPLTGAPLWTNPETGRDMNYSLDKDDNGNVIFYAGDGTPVYTNESSIPILGEQILLSADVRNALSLAIDREAIANAVVFAKAATALVPNGVFESNSVKSTFRANGSEYIASTANKQAALDKLAAASIDPTKFAINISYAAYDEVHTFIAEAVAAAWSDLGFKAVATPLRTIENEDMWTTTQEKLTDVKDDMWLETLIAGDYDVMAMDMVAISVDPFSVLAPFAKLFSGMGMDMRNFNEYGEQQYVPATHITGYDDETYNQMIEDIFAEKSPAARAEALHAAEKYLMEAMPVIPIIYNQDAVLVNEEMLIGIDSLYLAPVEFLDTYLKGSLQHDTYKKTVLITVLVIVGSVLLIAAVTTFSILHNIKKKKREEEIARISAEQEAKLREIRPGAPRR